MGVAKAASTMNVELITAAHCEAGTVTYDLQGRVLPKFWAQSSHRRVIASPINKQGMALDTTRGVMVIAFIAEVANARWIGRTAEAWMKTHQDGDQFPATGLGQLADIDPEIRTAVIAQGMDLLTTETHTAIAMFDLDDNGRQVWRRSTHTDLGGQFSMIANAVRMFLVGSRPTHTEEEMIEFVHQCGWHVQIIDG